MARARPDMVDAGKAVLLSGSDDKQARNARLRARNTASPRKAAQAAADRERKTAKVIAEEKAAQRRQAGN